MKLGLIVLALVVIRTNAAQVSSGQTIESVEIRGNRRVRAETIKYRLLTKPGDVVRADVIRRDIKELYAQGFFEDIRVDSEAGKNGGLIIIFTVKERPLIRTVDFDGANSITRSDILERLKQRKISISQESPYEAGKTKQVESVIKAMLAEKGHQDATVETITEDIPPSAIKLTFKINEGPAIKVEKINIQGNKVFSDRQIKKAMKLVKETNLRPDS